MQIVRSAAGMQRLALRWQRAGVRVGLVPTMGYLHEGHLSLVARARQAVGSRGKVAVSIYVNPTQFGPKEDLTRYPRNLTRDLHLCRRRGVDLVFVPTDGEMYPDDGRSRFSTFVLEEELSKGMEGASRPTHFRGVTTVVAKLFNLVRPQVAVFGAKDYQQAAIVKRMVRDLNFPVKILVAPTFREPDGLAMSSRNAYLSSDLRRQALVLRQAIANAQVLVRRSSKPIPSHRLKAETRKVIGRAAAARLDYVEFFNPQTLVPVSEVGPGVHMALAVFLGRTRLIDNARLF